MTRVMQSHGAQKDGVCETCGAVYAKKRFDQRFCSKPCKTRSDACNRVPWAENPNRERLNARRKMLYAMTRDETNLRIREDRAANPDKYREWNRTKYLRHKPKILERAKLYRLAHPDKRTKEYRTRKAKLPWTFLLTSAKSRSTKASLAFDLTREWAESVWTGHCAVSGLAFEIGTSAHYPRSPSIDRIDPKKGYTQANCRFVLFAVNSLKGSGTDTEMLDIAKAIANNFSLS